MQRTARPSSAPSRAFVGFAAALCASVVASSCALDRMGTLQTEAGQPGGTGGQTTSTATGGQAGSTGQCDSPEQCTGYDTSCRYRTCESQICGFQNAAASTPCTEDEGSVCDGQGNCLKDLGDACTDATECLSGFCADDLCCDATCDGICEACDSAGSEGACSLQPPGDDPDDECTDGVCDGSGACASGTCVWSQRFGDAFLQRAYGLAVDGSDDIIITGRYGGQVDFGGGALPSALDVDMFLAKFRTDGTHLWSDGYGGSGDQWGQGVATDSANRIATTGQFSWDLDLGGGALGTTVHGQIEAYAAGLRADGTHIWSIDSGGTNATNQYGESVATDSSDNVIAVGYYQGTVDFGGGALPSGGGYDTYLVKFDSAGNHGWSKRFGDGSNQYGIDVDVDSSDHIVVAGHFGGSLDFGGGPITTAGGLDIFVARLDPSGTEVWSKNFGDGSYQRAYGVAADAAGNVLVVGSYEGTVDFGAGPHTSLAFEDLYVVKLDSNGNAIWSRSYGGPEVTAEQRAGAVAVDSSGNVIVFGRFQGSIDFGGGPVTAAGQEDIFVLKLSPDGDVLWSRVFGGNGATDMQRAFGVAVNSAEEILLTGYFQGTINFGCPELIANSTSTDVYLAKLAP